MTDEQKRSLQWSIDRASHNIQNVNAGPDDLYKKADQMDVYLLILLESVVGALPQDLRQQAQACIDVRGQVNKAIMAQIDAHIAEWKAQQKKASSSSLQASNSL